MSSIKKEPSFCKMQEELNFAITEDEANFFNKNLPNYLENIERIKNFDFSKYEKYLHLSFDEKQTTSFSSLRSDEPVVLETTNHLFENAIEFKEGYVVLKNEK